jgi:hypothetical protein
MNTLRNEHLFTIGFDLRNADGQLERRVHLPQLELIYGVDFSGAKLAGRNTWIACLEASRRRRNHWHLSELARLEDLCGTAERAPALAELVRRIAASQRALWALDFPFGLPVEIMKPRVGWPGQLRFLRSMRDDAYALGVECLRRAKALFGPNHIRRLTDQEAKTPFDCYHYRIIYQTFHGMFDVLRPLAADRRTAILPFHYDRLTGAERVLVEACPGSTLRRLGLPHNKYKQAGGGPLIPLRRRRRHAIMASLHQYIRPDVRYVRLMMRNPGGDALDAVIAAVGALQAWQTCDHASIASHPRYRREGRLFI